MTATFKCILVMFIIKQAIVIYISNNIITFTPLFRWPFISVLPFKIIHITSVQTFKVTAPSYTLQLYKFTISTS